MVELLLRNTGVLGRPVHVVIHDNFSNRTALCRRCFIQISALSTVDGKVVAYHGYNGLAASQRSPGLVLLKEKYMTRRQVVTV